MNKVLKMYKALKEAKGFRASLARVVVAALVGIGGIALFLGFITGLVWLIYLPETHPLHRVLLVVIPPLFVLSMAGAVTLVAHIILFHRPGRGSQD